MWEITGLFSWKREKSIHGYYCICFTKGKYPNFTYIPWISRMYETEQDYAYEEEQLVRIAMNPIANSYWREQDVTGIAVIDLANGDELMYVVLLEK